MTYVYLILLIAIPLLAYIRLAPSDPSKWHTPITATDNKSLKGGAIRVIPATDGALERIHEAAKNLDRTTVLAGSPAEGRVTYVTRTRTIGFPDYTTVERDGDVIKMFARLRFGRSDLGVNAARLKRLIAAAEG